MSIGKIGGIILITIVLCLIIINRYIINDYREGAIDIILVLIILFAYIPAIIASLYILTDGLILKRYIGPLDYDDWDKLKSRYRK